MDQTTFNNIEGKVLFQAGQGTINNNGVINVNNASRETRNVFAASPIRNDSIYLQKRLLVREDIQSFLTDAFCQDSDARVVLHGLPGVGKTTMARHFAYENRSRMEILWIVASSEQSIINGFEKYARQICGESPDLSEPVSIIRQALIEKFPERWLLVLDGLDDTSINIDRYIFSDLSKAKILVTTKYRQVARFIEASHVLKVETLDRENGQVLLDKYIVSTPTHEDSMEVGFLRNDLEAKIQLVDELGGLPLAISIVGAALREANDISGGDCRTYLKWSAEYRDGILEDDPEFSSYPYSVWNAFEFAFQGILSGTGRHQRTSSMAYFVASCENASNIADYFRLYRQLKVLPNDTPARNKNFEKICFLNDDFFEPALGRLVAVNMVTCNWGPNVSGGAPYIEMHSLVRRWIKRVNPDQVLGYTAPKIRLVGFGIYHQALTGRIGQKDFAPLMDEFEASIEKSPTAVHDQAISLDIVLPFLIEAQKHMSSSISHLPVASVHRSLSRQFLEALELELSNAFSDNLRNTDWETTFRKFAQVLGKKIALAVEFNADVEGVCTIGNILPEIRNYKFIRFAFAKSSTEKLLLVVNTGLIQSIKADITARTRCFIKKYLNGDAMKQAYELVNGDSDSSFCKWKDRWESDVEEIVRRSLKEVLSGYCGRGEDAIVDTLPSGDTVNGLGETLRSMANSCEPSNAFFVALRRAAKDGAENYLKSSLAFDILNNHRTYFRDESESAMRKVLGDRANKFFPSSETDGVTAFSVLWDFAWHRLFLGRLGDVIAQSLVDSVSRDLEAAAREGFAAAVFEGFSPSGVVEEFVDGVFEYWGVGNMFRGWISSGWIDTTCESGDTEDGLETTYAELIDNARESAFGALQAHYGDLHTEFESDPVLRTFNLTLECRKKLHDSIMARLNRPNRTAETYLGSFLANAALQESNKAFTLVFSILSNLVSADDIGSYSRMRNIEEKWTLNLSSYKARTGSRHRGVLDIYLHFPHFIYM